MESQSYFNCGSRAVQFHSALIVVSPLNVLNQIDAKNITMLLEKHISKAMTVSEENLDQDKYDIRI